MTARVVIDGIKFGLVRQRWYLTREEFAKSLGMSVDNVRRLEQLKECGMQVKTFRRLAELLKMSPAELQTRIGVGTAIGDASVLPESDEQPAALRPDT